MIFLTAADLASKRGKALKRHCQNDDDLVGHGAIRWYYNFTGGINRECTDFSTPYNFPPKIIEAIKAGLFRGMGNPQGLLSEPAREQYDAVEKSAREQYYAVEKPALEQYYAVEKPAREQYDAVKKPAREQYDAVKKSAREQYYAVEKPAWRKNQRIITKTFWDLFSNPTNRPKRWR